MIAYTLTVFHEGSPVPTETVHCDRAAQVLGHIQALLARHADCHRVRVTGGGVHLFTVDCNGDRVDA